MIGFSREAKALRESSILKMLELTGNARKLMDLKLFPTSDVLAKYLDVGSSALVNAEGGIHYTYFLSFKQEE